MKRRRWLIAAAIIALAVAGWVAFARPWEVKPVAVATETVKAGPASRVLAVNGRVAAQTQVTVKPTVAGQIRTVPVKEGDVVKAGDVLATIDDSQQQAAVAQTGAALEASIAQLQQARTHLDRAQGLGDAISRKDLETAQVALQTAQNDVERLTGAKNQATSLLGQYTIRAPFDGSVLTRGVDPGQVVDSSTALFAFADLLHLRAEATVDELYAAEIRRGLKVKLQPSGYNTTLDAEVSFVSPTVDTTTGGREVRAAIGDTGGLTLPVGLNINVNIVVAEKPDAITLPRTAIITRAGVSTVLVVENGKAVERAIEYIDWPSARLVITSGLKDGDVVITEPGTLLPGVLVKPKAG